MSRPEFLYRANHGAMVPAHERIVRLELGDRAMARLSGYWRFCAPAGARCAYPAMLPVHGPRVCAPGAYAA